MSRGSGSGKGLSFGSGKGGRKGPPIVWDDCGSLGPDYFGEAVFEFPVQSKHDFTKDNPLRGYANRKEDWPKCMHAEDCLVQMQTSYHNGGRRFFKCPRAWSSDAKENCGFVRWVDPPPLQPHHEYIEYLQNQIQDLETKLDHYEEESDNKNDVVSQGALCSDPYCSCACHQKNGSSSSPPQPSPPPPPPMGGYYGEGATQFAMWGHY